MSHASTPEELGTEKISILLRSYAVPAIIAMTASSLYNMVDSIYIGHGVGSMALSALGVCFPLMNLSTAFGTLVGVGGSTMLSILLGQKKYDWANKVLGNIVSLNVIIGGLFAIACLIFLDPILYFFGATAQTLGYAHQYMEIILLGNIVTHLYFGLNAAMRSSGDPDFAMKLTLFTVVFNALLDPLFIFGFGMGVRGAAIATVIAQVCALAIILRSFCRKDRMVHLDGAALRLNWSITRRSVSIGMGPFLMNTAACVINLLINQQLLRYVGDLGIGAFGILFRISFLFLMIVMGFNQGMQPIAGFNFGACKYSRVTEVYKLTVVWAVGVTTLGFIASEFTPWLMCRAFTSDPQLLSIAVDSLRKSNVVFPIIGFQMVSTNLFQSLGMVRKSIFLSLVRQVLILIPCLYILPSFFGADGVWFSMPISDAVSSVITMILVTDLRKKFKRLKDGDAFGSTL